MRPSRPDPWDHLKVFDGILVAYDMKEQWSLQPPRLCVGSLHPGWPPTRRLAAYMEVGLPGRLAQEAGRKFQAVTATLEGKGKGRAKIHYPKKRQLMKLQKQAKKKVAKKTDRYTEVLKT